MEVLDEIRKVIESLNKCVDSLQQLPITTSPHSLAGTIHTLLNIKAGFQQIAETDPISNINTVSVINFIKVLLTYTTKLHEDSLLWINSFNKHEKHDVLIYYSKFQTLESILPHVPNVPKDDLFCIEKSHERWAKLESRTTKAVSANPDKLRKNFMKFMLQVSASQAFVSTSFKENNKVKRKVMLGLGAMYYNVFKKKALRKTQVFYAEPSLEVAQTTWNLVDSFIVKHLMSLMIPSIKVNKVIYIPRTVTKVTTSNHSLITDDPFFSMTKNTGQVMVRVLSHKKLPCFKKQYLNRTNSDFELPVEFTKVILHIHGGGFISMSSASHQVYTRKWAKELRIPIISVDYRLAPQYPYPDGLDDCWQVYNWILDHAKTQLGIDPQQIIIAGDSAGGNLTAAIAAKAIIAGVRIPDGLMLTYPALSLSLNHFSPSFAISLEDLLVPHSFLKICINCYLKDTNLDPESDPLISPLKATRHILQRFPSTRIVVGNKDPLHDDC